VTDIRDILEKSGVTLGAVDRIRLARGVVGKSSYVAAAALGVLLVLAFRAPVGWMIVALGIAAVVVFLAYFFGVLWFANKNPGLALLEGAELIKWRQMEMGLQGVIALPNEPNTTSTPLIAEPKP
jgi:hypothetical protein